MVPYVAKQRQRQARRALALRAGDQQQLYCRFEKRHGKLECAFSAAGKGSAPRPLLGETVRDWLVRDDFHDFLWCEKLPEGFALVLVIDGHVAKDGIFADSHVDQELRLALSQLRRSGSTRRIYFGDDATGRSVEGVLRTLDSGAFEAVPSPATLDEYLAGNGATRKLTSLAATPGVRAWNRFWRVVRYGLFAVGLAGVGVLVYWGIQQFRRDEAPPPPTPDAAKRSYARLLAAPPAGDVLLRIHSAYRDFVGDRVFADYSNVTKLAWSAESGTRRGRSSPRNSPSGLQITARLAVVEEDWRDRRQASAFPQQLAAYAAERGWTGLAIVPITPGNTQRRQRAAAVETSGTGFTVTASLDPFPANLTVQQAIAMRRPTPTAEDGSPSRTNGLDESLADLGTVQVDDSAYREIYETTRMQLTLRNAYWQDREIVEWLAAWLNDGPIVLDAVELQTVAGGGAADATTITFRLAWCTTARGSSTCSEPLTAADFSPPPAAAAQT